MPKIVECIPNFSVGNDTKVLEEIVAAIRSVEGILFLGKESDKAHNRSVVSFAGEPEAIVEAAFRGAQVAAKLINLNQHRGEHPRMGATDVIPFVPIAGVSMEDCALMAHQLGKRIGSELGIPVYLYEAAATRPERVNLADVRKGEYEKIKKEIATNPLRKPDYGPRKLGPAGATAIGAREPLVAYNVNLETSDLTIAKKIAKAVRSKDGGFGYVKALGFMLDDRATAQVSMNLVNYKKSQVHHVFEFIKREAARYGVNVKESEVIGLIPQNALFAAAEHFLQIEHFDLDQILEVKLKKLMDRQFVTLHDYLERTASVDPTPGGGSVAALCGALSAALISMVAKLTISSKRYKKVHKEAVKIGQEAEKYLAELKLLIEEDNRAYEKVVKAMKMSKNSEAESKKREKSMMASIINAAEVPMKTAETAFSLLGICKKVAEIGNKNAVSDAGVAALLILAAVKGAIMNVKINLKELSKLKLDKKVVQTFGNTIVQLEGSLRKKVEEIEAIVNNAM